MQKEEVSYLVDLKMNSGKSHKQAYEEIKRDVEFLKGQRKLIRESKKEIKVLEKKRKQMKSIFDKEFKKMSNKTLKQPVQKGKFCHTKYLQRMLNYLEEEPKSTPNKISLGCGIPNHVVKDGLLFLSKYNLTIKERPRGFDIYSKK